MDRNTTAALEITNNDLTAHTVTPTLLLRGSERVSLDAVTVPSRATRRILLNKILKSRVASEDEAGRDSIWGDGSRTGSIWGSAELQGAQIHAISSKILSENAEESLAVHSGFYEYGHRSLSTQWWLPTRKSSAFFAIQNTAYGEARVATLLYFDGRVVPGPSFDLPAGGSRLFNLRELLPKSLAKKLPGVGGVKFLGAGDSSTLLGRTLLFDESQGFSVPLPMWGKAEYPGTELQLAGAPFGRPAKGLGFSKAIRFTTKLLLTNPGDNSINVTVTLDGRNAAAAPVSWELPVIEVGARQSRVVDLDTMRRKGNSPIVDGHAGVRLTHTGTPLELLVEALTVDRTLRHSFDNALHEINPAPRTHNAVSFNLTGNKNTLLLIKNPSSVPVRFGYKLNYEKQGVVHEYKARLGELKPYELRVVDLRSLRDSRVPDGDGLVLPADVDFGNANIYSNQPIIAGDPNYDTVAGISASCMGCCYCQVDDPNPCPCLDPCFFDPSLCQPPPQQCPDTCAECQSQRHLAGLLCLSVLASCETLALNNFLNALNACENQGFCREDQPTFNEEECNRCKDSAQVVYFIALSGCAGAYFFCLSVRRDCTVPTVKRADCSACDNN